MQQYGKNSSNFAPPPGVYSTQQQRPQPAHQSQEQDARAGSSGNSTVVLAARIILGIVCALVIANTLRTIATSVYLSLPQSSAFVDAFDLLYMVSGIFDAFMRLVNAAPAIFLLIYAVRTQRVSSRIARIALAFWWALWLVGLGVYVFNARDVVTQEYFAQLIAWHMASALAPTAASVCVWLIQKGGDRFAQIGRMGNAGSINQAVHIGQIGDVGSVSQAARVNQAAQASPPAVITTYKSGPRIALGTVAGIVLAGCAIGAVALAGSFLEEANLSASGASGHEYLGALTDGAFGIIMLIPVVPAILCMVFACKPTRSTYVGAIVGLVLWWALWLFGINVMLPFLKLNASEFFFEFVPAAIALLAPPAVASLCVFLSTRATRNNNPSSEQNPQA